MWQTVCNDIFRFWLNGGIFPSRDVALAEVRRAFPSKEMSDAALLREYVWPVDVADVLQAGAVGTRCVFPDRDEALWPLRVAPFPEESITSWIIRIAARYHVPPRLIVEALGEKPMTIFDLDELRWGDLVSKLLAAMGGDQRVLYGAVSLTVCTGVCGA